jgi:hypothetical protein
VGRTLSDELPGLELRIVFTDNPAAPQGLAAVRRLHEVGWEARRIAEFAQGFPGRVEGVSGMDQTVE